jgi:hypothetical protein
VSGAIAGSVLLVAAVCALAAAALRVAALTGAGGLERAVAAAPLAVATAVAEALALGTVGLGGSGLALCAAALATWLCVRHLTPPPDHPSSTRQPRGWSHAARLAAGAAWFGWIVWALRFPHLGLDGSTYHLATVADWVTSGATGHSENLYASIPVGSYPLTDETAVAWAVGLAHSWAPVAAWSASIGALLVASGAMALRRLSVPPAVAALALAAFVAVPLVLRGLVHAETDVPAVAWLACTLALALAARDRPALLAPMLVAAALAIGTKTTVLPLTAVVVLAAAWHGRARLRPLARPLALAAALGFAAGGLWYLRNLIAHGSPLWPFVSAPWGDPVPPLLDSVDFSLLERPRETLEGQWPIYRLTLSGGLVLLAGDLLAPAWARRRDVAAAAAATAAALLAWASAPFTGAGAAPFLQVNTLRYLIPAMAAGALALALSGRGGRRTRRWVAVVLGAALAWSAKTYIDDPYLPGEGTLILASLAATAAAAIVVRSRARALPVIAAVIAMTATAVGGDHYAQRHAAAGDFDSGVVNFFTTQQSWRDGKQPIAFSPTPIALLAGNKLDHSLDLIDPDESCAQVRERLTGGWVVVRDVDRKLFGTLAAEQCLPDIEPVYDDGIQRVYGSG